jgi:hypothetical protein
MSKFIAEDVGSIAASLRELEKSKEPKQENFLALKLQEARDLITDKKNWCINTFSKQDGCNKQFCARGAVMYVLGAKYLSWDFALKSEEFQKIDKLLNEVVRDNYARANFCIADLNNNFGHEAVMKCFDAAIKKSQETF